MASGRVLVFPQAIGFGARALPVPGLGNVLCASALFPFRLSSGAPVAPADWYRSVALQAGGDTVPDSMAPLPGAEVLVFGPLSPVTGERREAHLRCGAVQRRFLLNVDAENPGAPFPGGPEAAVWHADDNPLGRGGPDDDRRPLIQAAEDRETPVWLGPTPFDHPVRARRAGTPDVLSGTGWPMNADPAVLYEAHPGFWAEKLQPGEPLVFGGLAGDDVDTALPPYRVTIVAGRTDDIDLVPARIQCVSLIPQAGLGAVIWRTAIPLGDDVLGESVTVLIAALEDADAPARDARHWCEIAVDRWEDQARALDDRPLLPAALAAAAAAPFALPDDDGVAGRHAAAEEWMREETGMPENPFAAPGADAAVAGAEQMEDAAGGDDLPNAEDIGDAADAALALGRQRHADAGFDPGDIDAEAPREPEERGANLDEEMARRLAGPYANPAEAVLAERIGAAESDALDAGETLAKVADARILSPSPPLFWAAFNDDEGRRFGDGVADHLAAGDPVRHLDVSGATVDGSGLGTAEAADDAAPAASTQGVGAPAVAAVPGAARHPGLRRRTIAGRRLDGLLAEETVWRAVDFVDCEFTAMSFAGGRFENCTFEACSFERVNLSRVVLVHSEFADCAFADLQCSEPSWMDCRFDRCVFERVSLNDIAMRDLAFTGGAWREMQWTDGLLIGVALRETAMEEVTFAAVHAPHSRFERLTMFKVWVMAKGFPGSVFEEVEASTCGFIAECHFDEARFERTRFVGTGFGSAFFTDAHVTPGCRFDTCDFTGAQFVNTQLAGVRFLKCTMATSTWSAAKAADAWFFGSILRGVDFADSDLSRAVFADADLEGAKLLPDKTIGADFRGTVRADR